VPKKQVFRKRRLHPKKHDHHYVRDFLHQWDKEVEEKIALIESKMKDDKRS